MEVMKNIFLWIILTFCTCQFLSAQRQQTTVKSYQDSLEILKKNLQYLKAQQSLLSLKLDSLVSDIKRKETEDKSEEDLKKLLEEANQLAAREEIKEEDISKKFHSGVRQQQGLNPNISLGGDFFAGLSSTGNETISEPGEKSYGNNGFFLREIELALESPLDPFTRGKTFISITKESISIEEAYMEWLNLPLKMNLKIGIFYAEFGPLNRYHDHALPQFDRPRALVNLFSNKGLGGTGLASTFMLPKIIFADASSLDITVMDGTNTFDDFSFANKGLLYLAQFKNFYDLTRNSYLEFRLSGVTGRNTSPGENRSYIGSLGISYKWAPVGREKYRTLDWKTEFLYSQREEAGGNLKIRSRGFYTSVQNKLNARFWIGGRIGYSELPWDNSQNEWDFSLNLDFWQSEFVFTRFQYQYNKRNIYLSIPSDIMLPNDHSIFVQVCWAMGPHKHEAY